MRRIRNAGWHLYGGDEANGCVYAMESVRTMAFIRRRRRRSARLRLHGEVGTHSGVNTAKMENNVYAYAADSQWRFYVDILGGAVRIPFRRRSLRGGRILRSLVLKAEERFCASSEIPPRSPRTHEPLLLAIRIVLRRRSLRRARKLTILFLCTRDRYWSPEAA